MAALISSEKINKVIAGVRDRIGRDPPRQRWCNAPGGNC